jgi:hypothetical protein
MNKKGCTAQLGISRRLMSQIMKTDLNLYPYKMRVLPKLTVQNKHQWMTFTDWAQNDDVLFNVWFSDEAHFHSDGEVNKQNVRFWVSENPCEIHKKVHLALTITVCVAISSYVLLGPIFFEETVNTEHYLSMLHNTFVLHLLATGLPL